MKHYSLRQRWIRFSLISVATLSLLYTVYCVVAMYMVEDALINRLMQIEIERNDRAPQSSLAFLRWYDDFSSLPADLQQRYDGKQHAEVAGDEQRHYHVRVVQTDHALRYLVAEVSHLLVVRPLRSEIMLGLLATGAILLLVSLWSSYRVATRLTAPLQQLTEALRQLKSSRMTTGITEIPPNEIGQLIQQLEIALQRIQQMLVREKQFTRDVSHELRTPLAVIASALSVLERDVPPTAQPLLNRMQDAVTRINQDLTVLLALVREETVAQVPPYSLLPVIEQCVIEHVARLGNKPIEVHVEVSADVMTTAPEPVLRIVLSNVISNAFIYCEQGQVTICSLNKNQITICDTGPGIEQASGASVHGLGIGLTIVRRLCEVYHILCQWHANEPSGTCITLTLPLTEAH